MRSPARNESVVAEATTPAAVEDVWRVLADPYSYARWVYGTDRIRAADPQWPAVGSRLHHGLGDRGSRRSPRSGRLAHRPAGEAARWLGRGAAAYRSRGATPPVAPNRPGARGTQPARLTGTRQVSVSPRPSAPGAVSSTPPATSARRRRFASPLSTRSIGNPRPSSLTAATS